MDRKMDEEMASLIPFLNSEGRLKQIPVKYSKKLLAMRYLAEKIEQGRQYTESEINDLLDEWTTFHDPATLRREMYNMYLLNRTSDCRHYWREQDEPTSGDLRSARITLNSK